jgi:hypothetical protein
MNRNHINQRRKMALQRTYARMKLRFDQLCRLGWRFGHSNKSLTSLMQHLMINITSGCYYYVRTYIMVGCYQRSFSCGTVGLGRGRSFACCGCSPGSAGPFGGSCTRRDARFILLFIMVGFFGFRAANGG